jgi:uncharacterized protein (TIGR03066 family)
MPPGVWDGQPPLSDRENDMRILRALAVACAALLLAGGHARGDDKTDAEKALLGKWQTKEKAGDQEVTAEIAFRKGGVVTTRAFAGGKEVGSGEGTYKVLDAKTLEVTFKVMGSTRTENSKFRVKGDTLELTDERNKTSQFTRRK